MTLAEIIDKILSARTKADFKIVDALLKKEYPANMPLPFSIAQALEAYELMRQRVQ